MKIIVLTFATALGSSSLGCDHAGYEAHAPVEHHAPPGEHHAPPGEHHAAPVEHHDTSRFAGIVEAEGETTPEAMAQLQSRATALGADRVTDVVSEPSHGGHVRLRGRAIATH